MNTMILKSLSAFRSLMYYIIINYNIINNSNILLAVQQPSGVYTFDDVSSSLPTQVKSSCVSIVNQNST